jgi:1-deoxy-D-xylulose-5-phosphate reductoisomerase
VLNAANEVAVEAFLQRRIRFDQIHQLNEQLLSQTRLTAPTGLDELLDLDAKVRSMAQDWVKKMGLIA